MRQGISRNRFRGGNNRFRLRRTIGSEGGRFVEVAKEFGDLSHQLLHGVPVLSTHLFHILVKVDTKYKQITMILKV